MRRYECLLLAGLIFLCGCNEFQQAVKDAKKDIPPPPKDNYIVLLDLSDRILFNNQQQVPKDIAVVKSIYAIFTARLNAKDPTHLYYSLHDKLKVLIAPQKTTPKNLYDMVGSLRIDLSAEQPDRKVNVTDSTAKTFAAVLPEIYKQAVIGNNSNAYSGADIWKYFNEDLSDDLEKDAQNTLFIITDGYMDLEKTEERPAQNNRFAACSQIINALKKYPDWETKFTAGDYGILPVQKKFSNLKVVLLQVNPKDDWNGEYSLLTKIWGKWFTEMGISNYRFIKDDNTSEVRESLEKFMEIKIAGKITLDPWTKLSTVDSSLTVQPLLAENVADSLHPSLAAVNSAPVYLPAGTKPVHATHPRLNMPDESDSTVLGSRKVSGAQVRKTGARDRDDILSDKTATEGFNTGIKKDSGKDPLITGRRQHK